MDIEKKFDPELELEMKDRADLSAAINHPGFAVILRIGRWMVDQFVLDWMNANTDEQVLIAHKYAKVAAQFFQGFADRINEEAIQYRAVVNSDNKTPIDVTSALDIDTLRDYAENGGGEPF
jgi:hypothetical protein